jgi:hypothetical protein
MGLHGDGTFNDGPAIQVALDAARPFAPYLGRGSVVLAPGRYRVEAPLNIKAGVVLCGSTQGPFDVVGINPGGTSGTPLAATLLIPNTPLNHGQNALPFITLEGQGAGITDILFHYPDQVAPVFAPPGSQGSPPDDLYPFTIKMANASQKVERCTVTNAYRFLLITSGRTLARDLNIGAFYVGIYIDGPADHVAITGTTHSVFWDIYASVPVWQSQLSKWTANNGYGFIIYRADYVVIENTLVVWRYAAFHIGWSPSAQAAPFSSWGTATDLMCDLCRYGIIANSTEPHGWEFANVHIVPNPPASNDPPGFGGVSAVAYLEPPAGKGQPRVVLNGGSIRNDQLGGWEDKYQEFTGPGSKLLVVNILDEQQ